MCYIERGEGIPLLLVHGFPLDHSMWTAQIDRFCTHCRVIAPDLPGFGRSPAVGDKVGMAQFADELTELLDVLEIAEPVVFCGLSMGGYIAFQFWRRHRSRLRGLVLCDSRATADSPEAAQRGWPQPIACSAKDPQPWRKACFRSCSARRRDSSVPSWPRRCSP